MDPITKPNFSNLEIDITSLPPHEEVKLHCLTQAYLIKLHVRTTLSVIVMLLGLAATFLLWSKQEVYLYIISPIFLLLSGWSYYANLQLFKNNGYALREKDIIYRRGYLFEKTTVVPYNRVQHVSVERSFLDRMLNLATLKIFTAGASGSDINIPGLEPTTARSLKDAVSVRTAHYA